MGDAAVDVVETNSIIVEVWLGLDLGEEVSRNQLVQSHPMLSLDKGLSLALKLGAQPAPQVQLNRQVVHCTAPTGVSVHLDLFAVDEIRAPAAKVMQLPPELEPPANADCLCGWGEVIMEE